MVVMCWDWCWWFAAGPLPLLLWPLGDEELLELAIVACLNSISSAGLQCRYAEIKFTFPPSLLPQRA